MMRTILAPIALTMIACSAAGQDATPTPDTGLTPETFDSWRAYIEPEAAELRWLQIPWRDTFYQGIRDSQIEGKPVLLWAMNGHPLGCV